MKLMTCSLYFGISRTWFFSTAALFVMCLFFAYLITCLLACLVCYCV